MTDDLYKQARIKTEWPVLHFSQSNGDGPGQDDVPALLRRVADTIAGMGKVEVQDIVFKSEPTAEMDNSVSMTVYFSREESA